MRTIASESWLGERDTREGWTPRDVIGHLISAEIDDWIPRAERIVDVDWLALHRGHPLMLEVAAAERACVVDRVESGRRWLLRREVEA